MTDTCYWVKENGAIETCIAESPPELTDGWVQFDTIPDNTGGRGPYDYASGLTNHPVTVKPAYGNGLIVVACMYFFGVQPVYSDGSAETQGIFVSDDDGFTYGPFIDKYPWLAGGTIPLGYDVSDIWQEVHQYNGTQISFDGSNFYVVASSVMDIDRENVYIRTSKSADGVNWTTNSISGPNHYVTKSACLNGDLWYMGTNSHDYEFNGATAYTTVGYSDNDGLTWSPFNLTFQEFIGGARPRDFDVDCSPNAEGLHIIVKESDDTDDGIYYYRPTSKTTWTPRAVIFVYPPSYDYYSEDGGMSIVASQVTPGNIYVSVGGEGGFPDRTVYFRRSIDGGVSWGSVVPIPVDGSFTLFYAWNGSQMVELADGRLVIVFVYDNANDQPELAYAVSSDAGGSFAPPVVFSTNEWLADPDGYYSPRLHICAKGNDVVVASTDRSLAGKNLIFRP